MRLALSGLMFGIGMLGCVLAAGCNQAQRSEEIIAARAEFLCLDPKAVKPNGPHDVVAAVLTAPKRTLPSALPSTSIVPAKHIEPAKQVVEAFPATVPPGELKQIPPQAVIAQVKPGVAKAAVLVLAPMPSLPPMPPIQALPLPEKPSIQPTASALPPAPRPVVALKQHSQGDLSVDPRWEHAADYSYLVGRIEHLHVHKLWRVRYAGCDEDDRFGGCLTLANLDLTKGFQDGQIVRVEGQVINPEARDPKYQLRGIQAIGRP